jgi:tetratricopeptide (TPR) repeat protein
VERNYWVRTEHGRIWGPYPISALERLRGQLTEQCEVSLDGKEWLPGGDFPELRGLLTPARKIERQAPATPSGPRISKAMAEAFGVGEGSGVQGAPQARPAASPQSPPGLPSRAKVAVPPQASAPPAPSAPPVPKAPPLMARTKPAPPPPPAPEQIVVPASGDLGQISPARLYALAAITSASGTLELDLEKGQTLRISFRRGTPEHLAADDPELSLLRFLQSNGLVNAEQAMIAEAQAAENGQDLVAVLFQMQVIQPADAHRLMGEHALFLLERALASWRGSFNFQKDTPAPPGASPLGQRWALLAESVRRMDVPQLRARLAKRLLRPVVRSGGLGVGKVEELALNAQEARVYAAIDGTKTGEELFRAHDTAMVVRLLYLLTELGHIGFADVADETEQDAPPARAAPPEPAAVAPRPPERELPKTTREAPRPAAAAQRPAPPPVLKAAPSPAQPAKPAAPTFARPPPTFAQPPADESPDAALERLAALWERLAAADHFEALGMERKSASAAEAKRNFFALAKELHPDTVTDPALADLKELKERLFARINEAAQVIGDDKRRKEYEAELDGKAENVDVSRIFAAEEDFQKAEIFIKARKYQEGLDLLEQAIQMNADEAEFYAWRGYAKFMLAKDRKQSFEECASDCRKAMKMIERCVPAHLFLGHMAKVLGDLKLAKKCYSRVLELDEKHIEAQRELRLMKA